MKVLFATDGSSPAHAAQRFLAQLHFPEPIELTVATVAEGPDPDKVADVQAELRSWFRDLHARARKTVESDAEAFEGINGEVRTEVLSGHAGDELVKFAEKNDVDLIVIGSGRHSAVSRFLLGSTSESVARHAPCSTLVIRDEFAFPSDRPFRVLICYDGSEPAREAIRSFAAFDWQSSVEVVVLSVVQTLEQYGIEAYPNIEPIREQGKKEAYEALAEAEEILRPTFPQVRGELREGARVAETILDEIDALQADLVVVGAHGRGWIERMLMGSVSSRVLRHAPCSVWISRGSKREEST